MPKQKDDEPVEFKVVDRRKFTAEGEARPDADIEPEPLFPPVSEFGVLDSGTPPALKQSEPAGRKEQMPSAAPPSPRPPDPRVPEPRAEAPRPEAPRPEAPRAPAPAADSNLGAL